MAGVMREAGRERVRCGAHHCASGDDERAEPTVSRICAAREREGISMRAGARAAAARAVADPQQGACAIAVRAERCLNVVTFP